MTKRFNIHDWQAKQRLSEQDDYDKRQDALTPGKNPEAFFGDDSLMNKKRADWKAPPMGMSPGEKSQESMSNADIKALQVVVGDYSLNKLLNTIAVIADKIGKHDEADMIQKLASQIQDFEDEDDMHDDPGDIRIDHDYYTEQSMTGTGASFSPGNSAAYASPKAFGNNKKKKLKPYKRVGYKEIQEQTDEDEVSPELTKDAEAIANHTLLSRINTKPEWEETMQTILDLSEKIPAITKSAIKAFLIQAIKNIALKK